MSVHAFPFLISFQILHTSPLFQLYVRLSLFSLFKFILCIFYIMFLYPMNFPIPSHLLSTPAPQTKQN